MACPGMAAIRAKSGWGWAGSRIHYRKSIPFLTNCVGWLVGWLVGWFAQYPLSQDCQGGAGTCDSLAAIFSDPHYIAAVLGQVLRKVAPPVGEYQRPTSVLTLSPNVAEATDRQRIPI
jgi:hypothetical protein